MKQRVLLLFTLVLMLSGCGDPFYDQYVTDPHFRTTGEFVLSKTEVIYAEIPLNGESKIYITDETITFVHYPIYNFEGKITKYYDGVLPNVICDNGGKSNGDTMYGFQNSSSGVIFNYLINGDVSIGIGDPDSGERLIYSKIFQRAQGDSERTP